MSTCIFSAWRDRADRPFLKHFLRSATGQRLEVYNADDAEWDGFHQKVIAQHRFVKDHARSFDRFVWVDAYDSLFMGGMDELELKFEELNSPIVFAAESKPWPDRTMAEHYPPSKTRWRFLNAGFWMATAEAALKMLEWEIVHAVPGRCDQSISVECFLSGLLPIKLDTQCSMVQCLHDSERDVIALGGLEGRVQNAITGTRPTVLHGNGKVDLTRWLP